jgi:hypothetical protein
MWREELDKGFSIGVESSDGRSDVYTKRVEQRERKNTNEGVLREVCRP